MFARRPDQHLGTGLSVRMLDQRLILLPRGDGTEVDGVALRAGGPPMAIHGGVHLTEDFDVEHAASDHGLIGHDDARITMRAQVGDRLGRTGNQLDVARVHEVMYVLDHGPVAIEEDGGVHRDSPKADAAS